MCTDKSLSMVFSMFHRYKNLLRYVKNGYPSNWCQNWYLKYQTRQSRVLMQRAWHLWFCLESYVVTHLRKGQCWFFWLRLIVVWYFWWCWAWLMIVCCCCCCCCCCHFHWKRWLLAFMPRAWHLHLCVEPQYCHLLSEGGVSNFSGWGWLLFDIF